MALRQAYRLGLTLAFLAGAVILLFVIDRDSWSSPLAVTIIFGVGWVGILRKCMGGDAYRERIPAKYRKRTSPPWNDIVPVSDFLFLLFICLAILARNPEVFPDKRLGSDLSYLFGGLAFLAGAPSMAAYESEWRFAWVLFAVLGPLAVLTGIQSLCWPHLPRAGKIALLGGGMVVPLTVVLLILRRVRSTRKEPRDHGAATDKQ